MSSCPVFSPVSTGDMSKFVNKPLHRPFRSTLSTQPRSWIQLEKLLRGAMFEKLGYLFPTKETVKLRAMANYEYDATWVPAEDADRQKKEIIDQCTATKRPHHEEAQQQKPQDLPIPQKKNWEAAQGAPSPKASAYAAHDVCQKGG